MRLSDRQCHIQNVRKRNMTMLFHEAGAGAGAEAGAGAGAGAGAEAT